MPYTLRGRQWSRRCSRRASFDAIGILGFLAAHTNHVELGSLVSLYLRTPTLIAMTAAGLDAVSGGRFVLGLGASGPQVVEGWHGVPFDKRGARSDGPLLPRCVSGLKGFR